MSSGVPSSAKDAHHHLRKQIGCINVIFQLFDRHHFFTGRHSNKRPDTGANHHNVEPRITAEMQEKSKQEEVREEQTDYDEPHKILSSPPPCSSIPYWEDCTLSVKTGVKEERIHVMKHIDSPRPLQKSHDLREVVKNSMYRETQILSAKNVVKKGRKLHGMKHIDSPRSLQHLNREAPFSFKEDRDATRDPCRFSYDGRESHEKLKSTAKLGELPRLSLDSRVRSRSNFTIQNLHEGDENSVSTPTTNQEFGSHRRSSSVVAKLMGLEGFPESNSINDNQVLKDRLIFVEKSVPMQNQETCSTRVSQKDSASPSFRRIKQTSYLRFPLEPAPWRQSDSLAPKKTTIQLKEASINPQQISSSVYSELEKRITELELNKSGKDLRALKQILEAMHKTRARLENQTQELADVADSPLKRYGCNQQRLQHNHPSLTEKRSCPPKKSNPSNPIKQSAKLNIQTRVASSSTHSRDDSVNKERKSLTPRKNNIKGPTQSLPLVGKINQRTSNAVQALKGSEHMSGGRHPALERSPAALSSPRLQKKKLGTEKQSHPNIPRRNPNKQLKESESPKRRQKVKSANQQQSYTLSEISSEQGDTASVQSESNNSMASYMETEVTSTYHNFEMGSKQQVIHKDTNAEVRLREDTLMAELATATIEQPSPVSVLDATFYIEDPPSPVKKKISIAFEDANEAEWHTEELENLPFSTRHNLGSEFNHKNLENIDHLLHKLRLLSSTPCEDGMNEIAPLYQSDNSDHQYITKILLASGLLKDLDCVTTTAQLHPSGHLVNPKLFLVLEQTEESAWPIYKGPQENIARIKFEQKMHRKLVFDTVNEILVQKLALESSLTQQRSLSAQQLLKELYAEIDHLRPESDSYLGTEDDELDKIIKGDMKHELEDWVEIRGELPALVLDVERLIFKDLITEVISREVPWLQDRPRSHPSQLFTS